MYVCVWMRESVCVIISPRKDGTIHAAINRPLLALRENKMMTVNSVKKTKAAVYHTLQSSSQCSAVCQLVAAEAQYTQYKAQEIKQASLSFILLKEEEGQ